MINTGFHMNNSHWISMGIEIGIAEEVVHELAVDAHLLVVRPVPEGS